MNMKKAFTVADDIAMNSSSLHLESHEGESTSHGDGTNASRDTSCTGLGRVRGNGAVASWSGNDDGAQVGRGLGRAFAVPVVERVSVFCCCWSVIGEYLPVVTVRLAANRLGRRRARILSVLVVVLVLLGGGRLGLSSRGGGLGGIGGQRALAVPVSLSSVTAHLS